MSYLLGEQAFIILIIHHIVFSRVFNHKFMTILLITCILCGIEKKEADEEGKGKYQEMLKTKAIEHKNVNKTTKSALQMIGNVLLYK